MPYPAENVITTRSSLGTYKDCLGVSHNTANMISSRKYNIHDASGKATMLKGFKYCRAWNRTFGRCELRSGGPGGSRIRNYTAGGQDCYRPLDGVNAWASSGSNLLTSTLPAGPSSNVVNATLVAALNKLKDQDFHLGNFAAEAHKTLEMVGNHAKRIAQQVERFRTKNPASWRKVKNVQVGGLPRNLWHTIPNAWLELQYGWKPLLQDIYGALHHLTRTSRYEVPYVYVRAHRHSSREYSENISLNGGNIFNTGTLTGTLQYVDEQDCFVNLVYGLNNLVLAELSSLGLLNPFEILWETTRFSFVVDWVLPVGPWLSALTADAGWNFITGSQSAITKQKFVGSTKTGSWPASVNVGFAIDSYVYPDMPVVDTNVGRFARQCYTSSPVPGLYVKNPLSFDHVANGLSLLVQAFR